MPYDNLRNKNKFSKNIDATQIKRKDVTHIEISPNKN